MAPGSIFQHLSFRSTILQSFIFRSINQKTQKYLVIFYFYLSLSDLTFASDREGIDNPFIALGASYLIVCAGIGDLCVVSDTSPSYLLFQTLLPLFWTLTCMI